MPNRDKVYSTTNDSSHEEVFEDGDDWAIETVAPSAPKALGSEKRRPRRSSQLGRYALQPAEHASDKVFPTKTRKRAFAKAAGRRFPRASIPPVCGDTIGERFIVQRHLGAGGMGTVYEASHRRLDTRVCIKTIGERLAGREDAKKAFYREARFAASLSHPNLISILDYDEDPNFGPFLVMELVEGKVLSHMVESGHLFDVNEACEIVAQIADAVDFVHQQGVGHGDIKSPNIMIRTTDAGTEKAKLIDFGLARSEAMHHDGTIMGTPEYLAPEICKGGALSSASDIYALGILLFELVCGQPPFRGAVMDILDAQMLSPPPRPSSLTDMPIPPELEQWILLMLSKDPSLRPKSASVVRATLKRIGMKPTEELGQSKVAALIDAYESTDVGLALLDSELNIITSNRAMKRLVSAAHNDIAGLAFRDTSFSSHWPTLAEDLHAALHGETRVRLVNIPFTTGEVELYVLIEHSSGLAPVQIRALPARSILS